MFKLLTNSLYWKKSVKTYVKQNLQLSWKIKDSYIYFNLVFNRNIELFMIWKIEQGKCDCTMFVKIQKVFDTVGS